LVYFSYFGTLNKKIWQPLPGQSSIAAAEEKHFTLVKEFQKNCQTVYDTILLFCRGNTPR
jgi:hypothetical protein